MGGGMLSLGDKGSSFGGIESGCEALSSGVFTFLCLSLDFSEESFFFLCLSFFSFFPSAASETLMVNGNKVKKSMEYQNRHRPEVLGIPMHTPAVLHMVMTVLTKMLVLVLLALLALLAWVLMMIMMTLVLMLAPRLMVSSLCHWTLECLLTSEGI